MLKKWKKKGAGREKGKADFGRRTNQGFLGGDPSVAKEKLMWGSYLLPKKKRSLSRKGK